MIAGLVGGGSDEFVRVGKSQGPPLAAIHSPGFRPAIPADFHQPNRRKAALRSFDGRSRISELADLSQIDQLVRHRSSARSHRRGSPVAKYQPHAGTYRFAQHKNDEAHGRSRDGKRTAIK